MARRHQKQRRYGGTTGGAPSHRASRASALVEGESARAARTASIVAIISLIVSFISAGLSYAGYRWSRAVERSSREAEVINRVHVLQATPAKLPSMAAFANALSIHGREVDALLANGPRADNAVSDEFRRLARVVARQVQSDLPARSPEQVNACRQRLSAYAAVERGLQDGIYRENVIKADIGDILGAFLRNEYEACLYMTEGNASHRLVYIASLLRGSAAPGRLFTRSPETALGESPRDDVRRLAVRFGYLDSFRRRPLPTQPIRLDEIKMHGDGCNGYIRDLQATATPDLLAGELAMTFTPTWNQPPEKGEPCVTWRSADGRQGLSITFRPDGSVAGVFRRPGDAEFEAVFPRQMVHWRARKGKRVALAWNFRDPDEPIALSLDAQRVVGGSLQHSFAH